MERLYLQVGALVAAGEISQDHALDGARAIPLLKRPPNSKVRYYRSILAGHVGGKPRLKQLLARVVMPPDGVSSARADPAIAAAADALRADR